MSVSSPVKPTFRRRTARRPAWRQALIDAERGIAQGLRADSTLFVHFFTSTVVLTTAFVLGISLSQWIVLILALTMVLSAEMFHHALKLLGRAVTETSAQDPAQEPPEAWERARKLGTAAVFLTILGAVLAIGLIFGQRLAELFE